MFECLDRFSQELATRFTAMENISSTFHIVSPKFLIKGSVENELELAVEKLNLVYGDFEKEKIRNEVYRLRRHVSATNTSTEEAALWSAKKIFEFIIRWDFTESLPNICLILQYFLTISVSVASCERSFSKLKLIKNYLRSTMSEERLASLSILSIERKTASVLDFDDVINKFSALKARKQNLKCL
nr:unnamed protein product [Callosobruchus analis]